MEILPQRTPCQIIINCNSIILSGEFLCPEPNGFFPDPEQCDKYYECVGEIPEEKFCPDGLLFEASNPNNELCDYPFNVDCGAREYVRKFEKNIKMIMFYEKNYYRGTRTWSGCSLLQS